MNVQDRLAETLYQRRCSRCGAVQPDNKKGWRKSRITNEWDVHVSMNRLCPACATDYDEWLDTPPEIPSSDTLFGTEDRREEPQCPKQHDQQKTAN
jgi:hypothetical protein